MAVRTMATISAAEGPLSTITTGIGCVGSSPLRLVSGWNKFQNFCAMADHAYKPSFMSNLEALEDSPCLLY